MISWKRVVKDDCVRSCLIELKFFLLSKSDVNPIHRVLMFLPYFFARTKQDAVHSGQHHLDLYVSLFIGSIDVKNTVCLVLKCCPPSVLQ